MIHKDNCENLHRCTLGRGTDGTPESLSGRGKRREVREGDAEMIADTCKSLIFKGDQRASWDGADKAHSVVEHQGMKKAIID
jgi:hypothetical protein